MPDSLGPSDSFEGSIFSRGLDIEEGTNNTPPNADRIRWVSPVDGVAYEQIFATRFGNADQLELIVTPRAGEAAQIFASVGQAFLSIIDQTGIGGTARIEAEVQSGAGPQRVIIDENQKSDFVQNLAEQGLKVIRGTVDTTLTIIRDGLGFSLAKTAVGDVTVTFTSPFSSTPSVLVTAETAGADRVAQVVSTAAGSVRFQRFVGNTAGLTDGLLHFLAIGPV